MSQFWKDKRKAEPCESGMHYYMQYVHGLEIAYTHKDELLRECAGILEEYAPAANKAWQEITLDLIARIRKELGE